MHPFHTHTLIEIRNDLEGLREMCIETVSTVNTWKSEAVETGYWKRGPNNFRLSADRIIDYLQKAADEISEIRVSIEIEVSQHHVTRLRRVGENANTLNNLLRDAWHGSDDKPYGEPQFVPVEGVYSELSDVAYTLIKCAWLADRLADYVGYRSGDLPMAADSSHEIFGPPLTASQFQCDVFMVMPFGDEFDIVYQDHIKPVVLDLGLTLKRGDDTFSKHDIIREIWSMIHNCRVVLADCTGKNPNVFYELGLAHALDKPTLMITQDIDDIPFDIRNKRLIEYGLKSGMKRFELDLKKKLSIMLDLGKES